MRRNRPKHAQLKRQERLKANCRAYANVYLRRGKLKKLPCQRCGSTKSEMHHPDYSLPLEVLWMCRRCHLLEHRK
jgi:ribosomal protein S27AE